MELTREFIRVQHKIDSTLDKMRADLASKTIKSEQMLQKYSAMLKLGISKAARAGEPHGEAPSGKKGDKSNPVHLSSQMQGVRTLISKLNEKAKSLLTTVHDECARAYKT